MRAALFAALIYGAGLVVQGADTPQAAAARKQFLENKAKAEKGDARAQHSLGEHFESGQVVAVNFAEAVKWYRLAAEQNYASAQYSLGMCCGRGRGIELDREAAAGWYRKAANQNHLQAMSNMGYVLEHGSGIAKNEKEAVEWYRKGAELNHSGCQGKLARCYENGVGMPVDKVEAYAWYSLSAASAGLQAGQDITKSRDLMAATFLTPQQVGAGKKRAEELRSQIADKLKPGGK